MDAGRPWPRSGVETPAMSEDAGVRLPPHSIEAEQSLLGGLMPDASAWLEFAERVSADGFYRPQHRLVFGVLADLADARRADRQRDGAGRALQPVAARQGGRGRLPGRPGGVDARASNVAAYARIVRERATLCRLLAAANGIAASISGREGDRLWDRPATRLT